jgi:2-keto-myo-inositol isomerase
MLQELKPNHHPLETTPSMSVSEFTRRQWLLSGGVLGAAAALGDIAVASQPTTRPNGVPSSANREPFGYCLNMSTIRGQKLELPAQIDVAADAGYTAVELWVGDVQAYQRKGGSLRDLASRLRDRGLAAPSAIAFFSWMGDDAARREKGLEQAKREMDLVRQFGGTRIAAPPAGAADHRIDLLEAARRYRNLLDVGASLGVVPELELWGFSKSLSRLGEAACVAIESGHPQACLLLDVFHIYKGGSEFDSLRFLNGSSMHVLHMNDYPASPPRGRINDAARVFPGDGVAPLGPILRTLRDIGFRGYLSLELFNPQYWRQDAHLMARTGLYKMKRAVESALA